MMPKLNHQKNSISMTTMRDSSRRVNDITKKIFNDFDVWTFKIFLLTKKTLRNLLNLKCVNLNKE